MGPPRWFWLLPVIAGCGTYGLEPTLGQDAEPEAPTGGDTDIDDDGGSASDLGTTDSGGGQDGGASDGGGASDDGGSDGGGSSTEPPPSSPVLSSLSAAESGTRVEVSFVASDNDGDLSGGRFFLETNGTLASYEIPGDLDVWSDGGTSKVYLTPDTCDAGSTWSFEADVEDAAGNVSTPRSTTLTLAGFGYTTTEMGDDGTATEVEDIGAVTLPGSICGDIWRASNDGLNNYTGDMDYLSFRAGSGGRWTFTLDWAASGSDYDFHLYDSNWNRVAEAVGTATSPPESMSYTVTSSGQYFLVVAAWSGGTGSWTVTIK
jgi:hypothetical protein